MELRIILSAKTRCARKEDFLSISVNLKQTDFGLKRRQSLSAQKRVHVFWLGVSTNSELIKMQIRRMDLVMPVIEFVRPQKSPLVFAFSYE